MTFPTLGSAVRWLSAAWLVADSEIPTRLHVHEVEPDSRLGSPKLAPKFLAHLAASAHDVVTLTETRTCRHVRLDGRDLWECPDCAGAGVYEAQRTYYRDPLASALDALRRKPGPWPHGVPSPHRLVVELVGAGYQVPRAAEAVGLEPDAFAGHVLTAIVRLRARYREAPPTKLGWTEKSDAQRSAEDAA